MFQMTFSRGHLNCVSAPAAPGTPAASAMVPCDQCLPAPSVPYVMSSHNSHTNITLHRHDVFSMPHATYRQEPVDHAADLAPYRSPAQQVSSGLSLPPARSRRRFAHANSRRWSQSLFCQVSRIRQCNIPDIGNGVTSLTRSPGNDSRRQRFAFLPEHLTCIVGIDLIRESGGGVSRA
jgi:hypothetical protein